MKKSHTFNLRGVIATLLMGVIPFLALAQSETESYPLYPSNNTPTDVEVDGTFSMNFTWTGLPSRIDVIKWQNPASSTSGSAYLRILDSDGSALWSGYPEELGASTHGFDASNVIFETNESYTLEFDLTQTDVTVYSNSSFPWRPTDNGPIEINTTELTGMVDQPVDPDYIFPYFTLNMVYSVSLDEILLENWTPHPNPATSFITLPQLSEDYTARMIDMSGKVVLNRRVDAEQSRLALSNLHPGVYLLQFTRDNEVLRSSRVVLQ